MITTPAGPALRRIDELPDLLTRKEASDYLGVSVQTMARWKVEGYGPRITKIRQHVRYRRNDIIAFVEASAA